MTEHLTVGLQMSFAMYRYYDVAYWHWAPSGCLALHTLTDISKKMRCRRQMGRQRGDRE